MADTLSNFKFPSNGIYLKEYPAKVRVLTTDPLVHVTKFGATKFAFVVYNHTAEKAQILDAGSGIAQDIQRFHTDDDLGANIQNIDIKLEKSGSGMETRYKVTPLANSKQLTNEQIEAAKEIDLAAKVENGIRMSEINSGDKALSQYDALQQARDMDDEDSISDVNDDLRNGKPVDLSDIPF